MKGWYLFFLLGSLWLGSEGMAQELRVGYYSDGTVRYKGYFKENRPVGEMSRFYSDGRLKAKMNHRGDTVDVVLYSRDGECRSSGRYIARKKTGVWEYRRGERLVGREEYKDNLLQGIGFRYYASGQPAEQKNWEAGKLTGCRRLYYENGKIRLEVFYKAGKLDGGVKSYDSEGRLRVSGQYVNDLKEGRWCFYNDQGTLQKEVRYHAGRSEQAEEEELEENRQLDAWLSSAGKIPDPAVFADDPEAYMRITGME